MPSEARGHHPTQGHRKQRGSCFLARLWLTIARNELQVNVLGRWVGSKLLYAVVSRVYAAQICQP